jgi:signal transduction histidine kinase
MTFSIRRKKLLNDSGFQLHFILYSWLLSCLVILSVYLGIYSVFLNSIHKMKAMSLGDNPLILNYMMTQQRAVAIMFGATSIVIFGLTGLFGLFLTNRVAGPMMRLQNDLRRLVNGEEVKPINLRKNDYFQQFADDLNKLSDKLKSVR